LARQELNRVSLNNRMTPALEQSYRDLASAELREPKLSLTRQYLAVHRVAEDESGPLSAGVVVTDHGLDVYFQLVDEHYFLVLCVIADETGPSVRFCRAEAKSRVYLAITSDTVSPEDVTAMLELTPTESWHRGDPGRHDRGPERKFHAWYFDPLGDGPGECDQKMKALLEILAGASTRISELAVRCKVCISVVYHGYQCQMWGLHWSTETVRRIAALGVEIDIDLYASGPDLPG
jgi:hypothetical protein